MRLKIFISIIFVVGSVIGIAQTQDEEAFRTAMSVLSDTGKLSAIDKFIALNPSSPLIADAYSARFTVLLALHQDSAAFVSAHRYLAASNAVMLPIGYHYIALDLVSRRQYLDSALVFVDSAIVKFEHERSRSDPAFFLTKSVILHALKRDTLAESILLRAVALLPSSAESDPRFAPYFTELGLIRTETRHGLEGVAFLVKQCVTTSPKSLTVQIIDSLLNERIGDSARVQIVRDSLFTAETERYIRATDDTSLAKRKIAVNLSRNEILKNYSISYATEAYHEAQDRSIEDRASSAATLGMVLYNFRMYPDAEKYLKEAADFVSPYETEILSTFGTDEEKLGKKKEAFDVYLKGVLAGRSFPLMARLRELQAELYPGTSLDSIIVTARYREMEFPVQTYDRDEGGDNPRVVLAELFTGSECLPCQAADAAFDKLIERYDRSSLAVLEYHLHIPRPDPLSNPDDESRAEYYSINNTPTAVFDGVTIARSGGTLLATKNNFLTYSDIIEKDLLKPADASLSLTASAAHGRVKITAIARVVKIKKPYRLHVVLAEDDVGYAGANLVSEHKFVVRKILKTVKGISFDKKGEARMRDVLMLANLEKDLRHYLQSYEQEHPNSGQVFTEKKYKINKRKLFAVAFVQDEETHGILQSKIIAIR